MQRFKTTGYGRHVCATHLQKMAQHLACVLRIVDDQHIHPFERREEKIDCWFCLQLTFYTARQPKSKPRPVAHAVGMRRYRTAVQLNQLLDYGETNTQAGLRPVCARVCLTEDFENMRQERRVDALPVVLDAQHDLTGFGDQLDSDAAITPSELHGIIQQVPDYLLQPNRIGFDKHWLLRRFDVNLDVLVRGFEAHGLNRVVN